MARDNRTIVRGIEIPEGASMRTYIPGQEDELEEVLTSAQVKHLTKSGALTGDWSGKATTAATLNPPKRQPTKQELSLAPPRPNIEHETPKVEYEVMKAAKHK